MASVTAPTAPPTPSQPQSEFITAMPLTDAAPRVAGSMIDSGTTVGFFRSPTPRMQAPFSLAPVARGVPVHLWREVEGNRPPPPPLPSH